MAAGRDHGGDLDRAMARHGGARRDWIDLSTGINPLPYPRPRLPAAAWTALPDAGAVARLEAAARRFWKVPEAAAVLAAPGASALIAQLPALWPAGRVAIPGPTYNEHAAAFARHGWTVQDDPAGAGAQVLVNPNNPDGRLWTAAEAGRSAITVIDESFCDGAPDRSLVALTAEPDRLVLKSFGKFWGLAGLRLGFVIGAPALVDALAARLGPWPVSGPALAIGAAALTDTGWAEATRQRLARDAARLDAALAAKGATPLGGTGLFRLYRAPDAAGWQARLGQRHIHSRIFPYAADWLRLGLPPATGWTRIEGAW